MVCNFLLEASCQYSESSRFWNPLDLRSSEWKIFNRFYNSDTSMLLINFLWLLIKRDLLPALLSEILLWFIISSCLRSSGWCFNKKNSMLIDSTQALEYGLSICTSNELAILGMLMQMVWSYHENWVRYTIMSMKTSWNNRYSGFL